MFKLKRNRLTQSSRRRRRFAGFEPLEARRVLATFVVTSTAGTGGGSLHQQIVRANSAAGFDEIVFGSALDGQSITLATNSLLITDAVRIDGRSLPGGITIDASGADPTPGENNGDGIRAFDVQLGSYSNGVVEFAGLTITGGDVTGRGGAILGSVSVVDSILRNNAATEAGGAIALTRTNDASLSGDLQIRDSLFELNSSGDGGALFGSFYVDGERESDYKVSVAGAQFQDNVANNGGAVWLNTNYGTSITGSTFLRNSATSGDGGGLWLRGRYSADLTLVSESTFAGNSAAEGGGGFRINGFYSEMEVRDCDISGNTANVGGGGVLQGDFAQIFDSTIEDNSAVTNGGGIAIEIYNRRGGITGSLVRNNVAGGVGGGISASSNTAIVTVASSTISGNSATGDGGGIWHRNVYAPTQQGYFELDTSTVSDNVSGGNGGGAFGIGATNSTISGNTAFARGGGIYTYRHSIRFSTIVNNRSDADPATVGVSGGGGVWGKFALADFVETNISHSIIAGNGLADEPGGFTPDDVNAPADTSATFNSTIVANDSLIQVNLFADLQGSNNVFDTEPMLGDLADNGGPTLTHLPLDNSPVIDAGAEQGTRDPDFDQRGTPFSRYRDGDKDGTPRYDLGAIEIQGSNVPPSVMAGEDTQVKVNVTLAIDGSTTVDPDNGPLELTYLWEVLSGPEFTGGFGDATQPTTTFVSDTVGVYELTLTADDGADAGSDTITVTVVENGRPTAMTTGSDQATILSVPALLVGTNSFDADGDAIVSYAWTLLNSPAESTAMISNPDSVTASLNPDVVGVYVVQLIVTDEAGNSSDVVSASFSVIPGEVFPGGPYVVIGDSNLPMTAIATATFGSSTVFVWDLDDDGEFDDATGRAPELDSATLANLQTATGQQIIPIAVRATDAANSAVGHGTITFLSGPGTGGSWHNPLDALDVDRDTVITPVDALLVINELNDRRLSDANGVLPPAPDTTPSYVDVDEDGFVSPLDALQVINGLPNQQTNITTATTRNQHRSVRVNSFNADAYFSLLDDEEANATRYGAIGRS